MTNTVRKELKIVFLRCNEERARIVLSKPYTAACPVTAMFIGDMRRSGVYGNLTPAQQIHANLVVVAENDIGWRLKE